MKKFTKNYALLMMFILMASLTITNSDSYGQNYVINILNHNDATGPDCSNGEIEFALDGGVYWDTYKVRLTYPNGSTYEDCGYKNYGVLHDHKYKFLNLPPGNYKLEAWHEIWSSCSANLEWYVSKNQAIGYINNCPAQPYVTAVIPESSPGCNNGIVYTSNGDAFYNLSPGYHNLNSSYLCVCTYLPYSVFVYVPGNPCQVSLTIDKADAIANCVNGSMVLSTTDAGTYVYHVAYLYDAASNLLRTKTFYSDKTDFDNVIPGSYTVEVRTYASYNSACYCSDTKQVTISSGGPLFYSPATTATDVGAHGCSNGKVRVDFNNVNDDYYLNYWNIPYKARYTAYLYDANWNIVSSANNLITDYEFTGLAPGNYNVLTVGTRYDAQGCNTPVWTNAIINQPSCITFDILSSTNTTTRCADDGTITASFTNWEGACDGYINLYKVAGTETLIDSWQIGDGALPATWSGLQSSLVFNGSYRVEAHAGDCTISQNINVDVPSCNVVVSAVGSNTPGCTGNISGSISDACALKTIALFRGANPITTLTTTDNNYNFEGLPSGTYTVSVTASDNLSGCTATSTARIRNANCPLPVNITATPTSVNKQILISWDNYNCATRYTIQYRIAGMTGWNSTHPTTNSKLLNNLFKNTVYEYRLKTQCSAFSSSDYSPIQTFCLGTCASRVAAAGNTEKESDLLIYPNPASDVVMIESGLSNEVIQAVNVFDQTGRMVSIDKTIEQGTVKINTSNFTDGIYFIQLIYPEGISQGKFIIQK